MKRTGSLFSKVGLFALFATIAVSASAGTYIGSHYEPYMTYVPAQCLNGCYIEGHYVFVPDPVNMFVSSRCMCGGSG